MWAALSVDRLKRRCRRLTGTAPKFLKVELRGATPTTIAPVTIVLPNGIRIEAPADTRSFTCEPCSDRVLLRGLAVDPSATMPLTRTDTSLAIQRP